MAVGAARGDARLHGDALQTLPLVLRIAAVLCVVTLLVAVLVSLR